MNLLEQWKVVDSQTDEVTLGYQSPREARGWYTHGFLVKNDRYANWLDYYGLVIRLLPRDEPLQLTVTCVTHNNSAQLNDAKVFDPTISVSIPAGATRLTLPLDSFGFNKSQSGQWNFVESVRLAGCPPTGISEVNLVKGDLLRLDCPVLSQAAGAGEPIEYEITVTNCEVGPLAVSMAVEREGWEVAVVDLSADRLTIAPASTAVFTVRVTLPDQVVPGGREKQAVLVIPNGDAAKARRLQLVSARRLPAPYLLHDAAGWAEVAERVARYEWAQPDWRRYLEIAERWQPQTLPDFNNGLFETIHSEYCMNTAVAWKISGKLEYAQKCAAMLQVIGAEYPDRQQACNQSLVQEGHFFQHIAMAYDLIRDLGLLSEQDQQNLERAFRVYLAIIDGQCNTANISNWILAELAGAIGCALCLQDFERLERFLYGNGGVIELLVKGVLDDGWWFECSLGYHVWVCGLFLQIHYACSHFGYEFAYSKFPAHYSRNVLPEPLTLYGMSNEIWGPATKNYRCLQDLLDSMLPFADYRGVVFAMNDSLEGELYMRRHGLYPYELAYRIYREPRYAEVIKQSPVRDLLYGVAELPESSGELRYTQSVRADNAGMAVLRSQKTDRPPAEQIQAVVKYGSHGGYHGHFDRTGLLSLMRYGRSFYNPEVVWYGYGSYLYKFYVQNSIAHNMTIVDGKNQEAVSSEVLAFHSGPMMQVFAVQTRARWANPPYGGMTYGPTETFVEKSYREGRSIPIPADAPGYGAVTGYTEPILQRRVTIVTDDYVLIFDYLQGEREHTFDNFYHIRGFNGFHGEVKWLRHTPQFDASPLSSGQFITNCNWYEAAAPVVASFSNHFGAEFEDELTRLSAKSEPGALNLDLYALAPRKLELCLATTPENHEARRLVDYTVKVDGRVAQQGSFGAWILGTAAIRVDLTGSRQLQLKLGIKLFRNFLDQPNPPVLTLFLAEAWLLTATGEQLELSKLPYRTVNVAPADPGRNYYGGNIIIAGQPYADAVPVNPADATAEALLELDLTGLDAVSFQAVLGGDYPLSDEYHRRKTFAVRQTGTTAQFTTLIEPFDTRIMVVSAEQSSDYTVTVTLADGRVQTVKLSGLEQPEGRIGVSILETGSTARYEALEN